VRNAKSLVFRKLRKIGVCAERHFPLENTTKGSCTEVVKKESFQEVDRCPLFGDFWEDFFFPFSPFLSLLLLTLVHRCLVLFVSRSSRVTSARASKKTRKLQKHKENMATAAVQPPVGAASKGKESMADAGELKKIRVTLSSKTVKPLEAVCAALVKGAHDQNLTVKGPVRMPTKVLKITTRKTPCGEGVFQLPHALSLFLPPPPVDPLPFSPVLFPLPISSECPLACPLAPVHRRYAAWLHTRATAGIGLGIG
jgi:ribosomal protein S10